MASIPSHVQHFHIQRDQSSPLLLPKQKVSFCTKTISYIKDPCGKSPFKETKKVQNEAVKQPLISLNKQDWIVKGYKIVEIKTTKMEIN